VEQSGRPQAEPTRFDQPWQPQDTPPPADRQRQPPPPPQARAEPSPAAPAAPAGGRRRRRRVGRSVMAVFGVVVLLILLFVADRVALAVTENDMASQFQSNGFPVKPSVTIQGFPFLTQLIGKDFKQVDISASDVPAGPVTITSVHATATGMHLSSLSSSATATIDKITATAFISNASLEGAGGLTSLANITATPAGNNILKVTASVAGVVSDTEELQITQTGAQTITVQVLPTSGIGSDIGNAIGNALGNSTGQAVSGALSNLETFSFNLPKGVPASLRITGLTLNSAGLTVSAAATNATFSQ
jgi:LmeA-like phospholipid-binding